MNEPELKVTGRTLQVSESVRRRNPELYGKAGSLPQPAERQSDTHDEPVAAPTREGLNPTKRFVRVKSFRTRLCDERNLWDKYLVDSLVIAGILHDDSPEWCKVKVEQIKVSSKAEERTEIEIL